MVVFALRFCPPMPMLPTVMQSDQSRLPVEVHETLLRAEEALNGLARDVEAGRVEELRPDSEHLLGAIQRLVRAVEGCEGIVEFSEELKDRYQSLLDGANGTLVACFWRSLVLANFLRDAGVDAGTYGPDGSNGALSVQMVSAVL
ncbi:MAG: hypothetical protein ACYDHP_05210 [Ferrimicrobium sp.]